MTPLTPETLKGRRGTPVRATVLRAYADAVRTFGATPPADGLDACATAWEADRAALAETRQQRDIAVGLLDKTMMREYDKDVAALAASEPLGGKSMNILTIDQQEAARMENAVDKAFGLRQKYVVTRIGGTPHKHDDCDYFVLDWNHDRYARVAALAYADACEAEFPALATDLRERAALAASGER